MEDCTLHRHPVSRVVAIALLLAIPPLVIPPAAAQPRELRITTQMPPGSMQVKNLTLFKERVETETNGALKVAIFPSAQLLPDNKVIGAVVAGQVEMGASRIGHFVEAVPAIGIFLLPYMFNVPAVEVEAMKPASPVRHPLDQAVLEKTGARVLWWQPFGSFVWLSKSVPVASPAAMAGKTVRVFDKNTDALVRSCGGNPVYLSAEEHYGAYKAGQVDVGQAPLPTIVSRKFWEVMDTLSNTRHLTDAMLIIINEQVWQALSVEHKRILDAVAAQAQEAILVDYREREREGYVIAARNGMKVVELSRDQIEEWKTCAAPLLEGYLDRSGALGAKALSAYRDVLTEIYRTPTHAPKQR
jgi:C4-dicarboxylate-binding protein DctP